jgi:hypothetical protein
MDMNIIINDSGYANIGLFSSFIDNSDNNGTIVE